MITPITIGFKPIIIPTNMQNPTVEHKIDLWLCDEYLLERVEEGWGMVAPDLHKASLAKM